GSSSRSRLPYQLRPVVVPAPAEGVVRQAFSSAIEDGPPSLRLPRGSKQAWAHFRFATQPASRLPLTGTSYMPSGKKLGTSKTKPNRPEVVNNIGVATGQLPPGAWVAELRAGTKVVKRLTVRVG